MFYAEKENGAYFNNKRIKVSKRKEIGSCLFATGGQLKNEINLPIRKTGSAALDIAYVAAGRFDGYFQNDLNLWDIAAGIIIINEAGGIINSIDLKKNKSIEVLASSSNINQKMLILQAIWVIWIKKINYILLAEKILFCQISFWLCFQQQAPLDIHRQISIILDNLLFLVECHLVNFLRYLLFH